ncbi:putative estradiol 17-beta-dehydrogenase 11 [Venustampulla echinocandica]|uniref:Short-chain dehydrogenase/reductase 3 n=1 Tax=Venustampulla echinocandica TaxID=2656787 RepID=A0A370U1X9_9HELO|nr:putative estradiol 17-beta-dehydrogenase 11 [Venustampulla echinocandica]RDL41789.1 putative estradiol 17-beta-dehydrogenase 11 [Venustampulla echinocandica]
MPPSPLALPFLPLRLVASALSTPLITGPLLFAILYNPSKLYSILPVSLHKYITPGLIRALKVFFVLGLLRKVSNKASKLAINNWKSDGGFNKEKELVLITGASSGIGLLMAKEFAEKGLEVVNFDLGPAKESLPSNIHFYEVDVTSSAQISKAAAEVRKAHGEPTVVINNAGIGACRTILDEPEEMIQKTFAVNNVAHFWMIREFLPNMIEKNHGHVVTIASMSSFIAPAQLVDYACTKTAAMAFHEGLSSELRARYKAPNVRTTIVHPSWIRTPLIETLYTYPAWNSPLLEPEVVSGAIVKQVLSGKSGSIILPKGAGVVRFLRAFPGWFQMAARNRLAYTIPPFGGV